MTITIASTCPDPMLSVPRPRLEPLEEPPPAGPAPAGPAPAGPAPACGAAAGSAADAHHPVPPPPTVGCGRPMPAPAVPEVIGGVVLPRPSHHAGSKRFGLPHYLEDCPAWKPSSKSQWWLQGRSVGGDRSGFMLHPYNVVFDAGVGSCIKPSALLVTHAHIDHSYQLPMLLWGAAPDTVVTLPKPSVRLVNQFWHATALMEAGVGEAKLNDLDNVGPNGIKLRGVRAGDVIALPKHDLYAHVVACEHTIPTVGYVVHQMRHKLRPEYVGQPGAVIAAARKAGKDVEMNVSVPLVAYMLDNNAAGLAAAMKRPQMQGVPVVITECTFLLDSEYDAGRASRHTCWQDLAPIIEAHAATTFVLVHFSSMYDQPVIRDFFQHVVLPRFSNVVMWTDTDIFTPSNVHGHAPAA